MQILIVDNDIGIIQSLKNVIEPAGFRCKLFQNPSRAIEAAKDNHYDVLITELNLYEIDGIEFIKQIKAYRPLISVVIITGYTDVESIINAINLGVNAFYLKPLELPDIMKFLMGIEKKIKFIRRVDRLHRELKNSNNKFRKLFDSCFEKYNIKNLDSKKSQFITRHI